MSRKTSTAERNYSATEKEFLSIITTIRKCRMYLAGTPFTVVTDHEPLLAMIQSAGEHNSNRVKR